VRKILECLDLDTINTKISSPYFAQTADELSEEWAQRFREERQQGWENRGW